MFLSPRISITAWSEIKISKIYLLHYPVSYTEKKNTISFSVLGGVSDRAINNHAYKQAVLIQDMKRNFKVENVSVVDSVINIMRYSDTFCVFYSLSFC